MRKTIPSHIIEEILEANNGYIIRLSHIAEKGAEPGLNFPFLSLAHLLSTTMLLPHFTLPLLLLLFFFFFCLLRAAPMACGGSQDRGQVGAVATGLYHSHSN